MFLENWGGGGGGGGGKLTAPYRNSYENDSIHLFFHRVFLGSQLMHSKFKSIYSAYPMKSGWLVLMYANSSSMNVSI